MDFHGMIVLVLVGNAILLQPTVKKTFVLGGCHLGRRDPEDGQFDLA
jgi:hypothetical protein